MKIKEDLMKERKKIFDTFLGIPLWNYYYTIKDLLRKAIYKFKKPKFVIEVKMFDEPYGFLRLKKATTYEETKKEVEELEKQVVTGRDLTIIRWNKHNTPFNYPFMTQKEFDVIEGKK